ncbi:unnamed protein product [Urochloa decumbens]|uniref:Uncharacterized protein n=1 Tax=Urochloa decumbens TaxID=240449 RepID=A0ABC9D8H6_9POAL
MEDSSGSSPSPAILRNRYWILRHGRSVPNERGLIVSSLENGAKPEYGLAPPGFEQARAAGELLRKELEEIGVPVDSVKIRYSPFSRTTETARVVAGVLGIRFVGPSCEAVTGLRERYFGPSYELLSHDKRYGRQMKHIPIWLQKVVKVSQMSLIDFQMCCLLQRQSFIGIPLSNPYCQPWGPTTNLSSCTQWSQGELIFP